MSNKTRTSVSIDEENKEFLDDKDINLSQLVNEAVERKRTSVDRKQELRDEIAEKEDRIKNHQNAIESLEREVDQLRDELEQLEEQSSEVRNNVEKILERTILNGHRNAEDLNYADSNLTGTEVKDLVEYVDLHSTKPTLVENEEALQRFDRIYDNIDETNIAPPEFAEEIDEVDDSKEYQCLTKKQKEMMEEWLTKNGY